MLRHGGLVWLATAAGCLFALLAGGCSDSDDKQQTAAQGATGDAATLAENFSRLKSFRAVIGQGESGPGLLQGTVEYKAPDEVHVTAGSGSVSQELLCIGDR